MEAAVVASTEAASMEAFMERWKVVEGRGDFHGGFHGVLHGLPRPSTLS